MSTVAVQRAAVEAAVAAVTDPEYPDVSIVDLGLVEAIEVADDTVVVGLIPTFSGCPALGMIADDVRRSVDAAIGAGRCRVEWRRAPVWTVERMSADARAAIARDYAVAVQLPGRDVECPVCGGHDVRAQSMAGPTRCRSVSWCASCRNPVEVIA